MRRIGRPGKDKIMVSLAFAEAALQHVAPNQQHMQPVQHTAAMQLVPNANLSTCGAPM